MSIVSPPCPCLFRIETAVLAHAFWSIKHAFWKARFTVSWFAYSRLERNRGSFAAVGTFNLKHTLLHRDNHLYSSLGIIEKSEFSNYHNYRVRGQLKGFHQCVLDYTWNAFTCGRVQTWFEKRLWQTRFAPSLRDGQNFTDSCLGACLSLATIKRPVLFLTLISLQVFSSDQKNSHVRHCA